MRAAIYLRVSTDEQTTENQERELRVAADRIGHEIVAVYRDAGISGSKGRDQRPGFDAMHKDAARRRFAGIARAKAGGKHCGRPFIDTKLEGRIRAALAAPDRPGLHKLAKQFGVGTGTVQRIAATV
jgi:DNA invertase Pin-like site-specific DNA recombinase